MSALLVRPLPFTAASTSPTPLAGSVANLNLDLPGLAWRFGLTTPYLIVDMGSGTLAYDTIALVGANLRATDTVQIRTGTTNTGIGGYAGTALAAWSGSKADVATADCIFKLGSVRTERYIRIDLSAPSHPDGYVQFTRLVVGKAAVANGVQWGAQKDFVDWSIVTNGPGYRSVDEYPVVTSWKFDLAWITEASWRSDWEPLFQWAGSKKGVLFIPDDTTPSNWQTDAIFGCFTTQVNGKDVNYDNWTVSGAVIQAIAA